MARLGKINHNEKRKNLTAQYAEKRKALKEIILDPQASFEEKLKATARLEKLPLNSSKIRIRNRCSKTGRARGFIGTFGLSRSPMRDYAVRSMLPGVQRSSW